MVLRSQSVSVASDIGRSFIGDCARYIEGLIAEADIKNKWGLTDETWQGLEQNVAVSGHN